ncbi:MAG: metallophosphoesterase family protein [Bacteroidales bacterium]|nr:metallophosphoesterase family protein [Bacteroidales bacterium]
MKRIGVLSDTHGAVPPQVYSFFKDCDELWHAGDLGPSVLDRLRQFKLLHAVYGNIDDNSLHHELPLVDIFVCEGQKVMLTHIGGWPGHYPAPLRQQLQQERPDIFVCGHSHILKVMYDNQYNFLHINPGAAGHYGFHKVSTLVRFTLDPTPRELEILDFPKTPHRPDSSSI